MYQMWTKKVLSVLVAVLLLFSAQECTYAKEHISGNSKEYYSYEEIKARVGLQIQELQQDFPGLELNYNEILNEVKIVNEMSPDEQVGFLRSQMMKKPYMAYSVTDSNGIIKTISFYSASAYQSAYITPGTTTVSNATTYYTGTKVSSGSGVLGLVSLNFSYKVNHYSGTAGLRVTSAYSLTGHGGPLYTIGTHYFEQTSGARASAVAEIMDVGYDGGPASYGYIRLQFFPNMTATVGWV